METNDVAQTKILDKISTTDINFALHIARRARLFMVITVITRVSFCSRVVFLPFGLVLLHLTMKAKSKFVRRFGDSLSTDVDSKKLNTNEVDVNVAVISSQKPLYENPSKLRNKVDFLQSPHATIEVLLAEKEHKQSGKKRKRSFKSHKEDNLQEAAGSQSEGDESQEEDDKNTSSKLVSDEEINESDEDG
ncbi:hypothetical protein Tco_0555445 [Tanacetum coccineum]